jgi:hypothetical protein
MMISTRNLGLLMRASIEEVKQTAHLFDSFF